MGDPVTLAMAVATAVVGKVAETLTEKGQEAVAEIVRKIRGRLTSRPDETAMLDAAVGDEADAPEADAPGAAERVPPAQTSALERVLDREFAADPGFRAEIEALWRQVGAAQSSATNVGTTTNAANATNVFTGTAEKVIQIGGDVRDLTIN